MDRISGAWKGTPQCEGCSTKLSVFRRKKPCFSCKNYFCKVCIMRRPDKKMCCRKCQILTATPLDKNDLLNLRSRDLVNYLASRHISTSGCVEKEDLVNVLMKAVNNSNSTMTRSVSHPTDNNYGNRNSVRSSRSESNGQRLRSGEQFNEDGIRIIGTDSIENESSSSSSHQSSNSELLDETDWVVVNDNNVENTGNIESSGDNSNVMNPLTPSEAESSSSNQTREMTSRREENIKPLKLSDISSSAELDNLSVKELKTLLMTNRTDFKGCVERAELIEKASRLWSDYTLSRRDLEKLSLEELCKICMDAPIECVLLECGHMATCMCCGKQLSECPVCRQYVVRCVRTFKV